MFFRLGKFVCVSAAVMAGAVSFALATGNAQASTYTVLHAFCPDVDYPGCANDGWYPLGTPIVAPDGTVYGTNSSGGPNGTGVLFALKPKGSGYVFHVMYGFCGGTGCAGSPRGRLILDTNGNIYGVADGGGNGYGTVYKFAPNKYRTGGKLSVLYNFCANGDPCPDGQSPNGIAYIPTTPGAAYDGKSPLYGSSNAGGNSNYGGTVFELKSVKGQTLRNEITLYTFCSRANCTDGRSPQDVNVNAAGDVVGTTLSGGKYDLGVAFKVDSTKTETVLRNYCSDDQYYCYDGKYGTGPLLPDPAGNLWGETQYGGNGNQGVVFELQLLSGGKYKYVKRYDFCQVGDCLDGALPTFGLTSDGNGNLFGITQIAGLYDNSEGGTIFEMKGGTHFRSLYSFCAQNGCTDGHYPRGGVALDSQGNIYGTTADGGNQDQYGYGRGVIYKLTP